MEERGLFFAKSSLVDVIRSVGGTWDDQKERPMVCLIKSKENDKLYWAIPMGNLRHRDAQAVRRIMDFVTLPNRDIRSCYYHIGNTTVPSIFFVSDAIPITDKYVDRPYCYEQLPYIIKNEQLIEDLKRKLFRILSRENRNRNSYRQHISSVKDFMLQELTQEQD